MSSTDFNLLQAAAVLQRKWKTLVCIILVTMIVATITLFVVPPCYRSAATIVSANPLLADKSRLFNDNIQSLYSYFGSGDDLDRITGIAKTDHSFELLVDTFQLVHYYQLHDEDPDALRKKAVLKLQDDISFQRTEQGQLKIVAWTKDNHLSANLVNKLVSVIQQKESAIWQNNYRQSLDKLNRSITTKEKEFSMISDSLHASDKHSASQSLLLLHSQTLLDQLKQYHKTADEFQLAMDAAPPVLYVLENAVPAPYAERPAKREILIAAACCSFVFGCLLLLVTDRKQGM